MNEDNFTLSQIKECAHFHYDFSEIGKLCLKIVEDGTDDHIKLCVDEDFYSIQVNCVGNNWMLKRSLDNLIYFDKYLHSCIYDSQKNPNELRKLVNNYLNTFSSLPTISINCAPILNWLQMDNKGNHLVATVNADINIPAITAAYVTKPFQAKTSSQISFEAGDIVSVIEMPSNDPNSWWKGKRGFERVPKRQDLPLPNRAPSGKTVNQKHSRIVSFLQAFFSTRPSKRKLKEIGIFKERVFGCDLGEYLMNSKRSVPSIVELCTNFIETYGVVDGIYRLSGISSNIQKLRNIFDEEKTPNLTSECYVQDINSVSSVLKMYFRELPNPLLTYQLYDKFNQCIQSENENRLHALFSVVQQLPPPHYRTLAYLMKHLSLLAGKASQTNMTIKNLAIVWAPNLLRSPNSEYATLSALHGVGIQAIITESLILYADIIFNDKLPSFISEKQKISSNCSPQMCVSNIYSPVLYRSSIRNRSNRGSDSRPKSLAMSSPLDLDALKKKCDKSVRDVENMQAKSYQHNLLNVGGGPQALPPNFHTVITLPDSMGNRKLFSTNQKKSLRSKESKPGFFATLPAHCTQNSSQSCNSNKALWRIFKMRSKTFDSSSTIDSSQSSFRTSIKASTFKPVRTDVTPSQFSSFYSHSSKRYKPHKNKAAKCLQSPSTNSKSFNDCFMDDSFSSTLTSSTISTNEIFSNSSSFHHKHSLSTDDPCNYDKVFSPDKSEKIKAKKTLLSSSFHQDSSKEISENATFYTFFHPTKDTPSLKRRDDVPKNRKKLSNKVKDIAHPPNASCGDDIQKICVCEGVNNYSNPKASFLAACDEPIKSYESQKFGQRGKSKEDMPHIECNFLLSSKCAKLFTSLPNIHQQNKSFNRAKFGSKLLLNVSCPMLMTGERSQERSLIFGAHNDYFAPFKKSANNCSLFNVNKQEKFIKGILGDSSLSDFQKTLSISSLLAASSSDKDNPVQSAFNKAVSSSLSIDIEETLANLHELCENISNGHFDTNESDLALKSYAIPSSSSSSLPTCQNAYTDDNNNSICIAKSDRLYTTNPFENFPCANDVDASSDLKSSEENSSKNATSCKTGLPSNTTNDKCTNRATPNNVESSKKQVESISEDKFIKFALKQQLSCSEFFNTFSEVELMHEARERVLDDYHLAFPPLHSSKTTPPLTSYYCDVLNIKKSRSFCLDALIASFEATPSIPLTTEKCLGYHNVDSKNNASVFDTQSPLHYKSKKPVPKPRLCYISRKFKQKEDSEEGRSLNSNNSMCESSIVIKPFTKCNSVIVSGKSRSADKEQTAIIPFSQQALNFERFNKPNPKAFTTPSPCNHQISSPI